MGVDLGGTNGLIIGAAGPTGTDLARRALDAGVARLVLCDTVASGWISAPTLEPHHHGAVLDVVRLDRGDPIELAQLFACVRHDHGPLDWVCAVGGPGASAARRPANARSKGAPSPSHPSPRPSPRPSDSERRGSRRPLAEVIPLAPPGAGVSPPARPADQIQLAPLAAVSAWPELSLARIVARTEHAFVRSALITRLALEEFRHRGGALLHVWAGEQADRSDALWEANRAAVEALVSASDAAGAGACEGGRTGDGARIGFVETVAGAVHDAADRLAALLGREPSPVVSLIRDSP